MTAKPAPTSRFISYQLKLLGGFTVIFTIVFATAYYWFYRYAVDLAFRRIREDHINTMVAAAEGIDTDSLLALYREGQPNADGFSDDPRYIANLDWLATVHAIEPRAWPGTYIVEGDQLYFVTDLFVRYDTSRAVGFKFYCDPDPAICGDASLAVQAVTAGQPTFSDDILPTPWGNLVSGWAPIKDKDGRIVGGLFLDFLADYVVEVQTNIRNQVIIAFAITYLILIGLVYFVSRSVTRPILALTRAAERIGEGDYKQDLSQLVNVRVQDEISAMANVFTIMVGKVRQREQTLIQQVEELKIEIDDTKRKRQVSEIVDSEFFQDLQAKSRAMRRRRASEETESASEPRVDQSE